MREVFSSQENFVLKLHLEYKKTNCVDCIMQSIPADMEELVRKVSRFAAKSHINSSNNKALLATKNQISDKQDEFAYLLKQHMRAYMAGLTLIWILHKEERKVFDNQSNQISQLFDHLSQSAQLMQEILLVSPEVDHKLPPTQIPHSNDEQ